MIQKTISEQILQDPIIFWLSLAFAIFTLVQLIYFWGIFSRLAFYREKNKNEAINPVSVVITANNQYVDLKDHLPAFLSQDYPHFEVVVVIDNSNDGSDELLGDLSREYSNLKIVELHQKLNWFSGRKFPLSLGIKSATHNLILLSDPTCLPENPNWIREMLAAYSPEKEIVIGYSTYKTSSSINKWLRFTAFYDALLYVSMAISGSPFKGIGKNLSYSRNLFYKHKGFSSHYVISAGDDELFVNKTANKSNVAVQVNAQSRILQIQKISFGKWLLSEKSRLKIRRYFKFRDRVLIGSFSFSSLGFYALFISLLILRAPLIVTGSIFALRFISQMLIFGFVQKKLSEKKLLLFSPLFEIFLIVIDFFIWISLFFKRKNKWT